MNVTKEQADKVIKAGLAAKEIIDDLPIFHNAGYAAQLNEEALTIMRGLEDAAPVCNHEWFQTGAMLSNEKRCIKCGEWGKLYTSPQAAQTALQSESSAQAAQALARLPSEGKPIEALAPTEAALSEVVRLSEDAGLYDDFQTEAQEREAFEAFMLTKYPTHVCNWVDGRFGVEDRYSDMFTRLIFVGWLGRAGSKP